MKTRKVGGSDGAPSKQGVGGVVCFPASVYQVSEDRGREEGPPGRGRVFLRVRFGGHAYRETDHRILKMGCFTVRAGERAWKGGEKETGGDIKAKGDSPRGKVRLKIQHRQSKSQRGNDHNQ